MNIWQNSLAGSNVAFELSWLKHRPTTERKPNGGFGLEIVRERLRAAFGDAAQLDTGLTADGLFQARLRFPLREWEKAA
ncbi:MAG TPA: hypothetical protein VF033_01885 [Steroidobacteraceae bacterium]